LEEKILIYQTRSQRRYQKSHHHNYEKQPYGNQNYGNRNYYNKNNNNNVNGSFAKEILLFFSPMAAEVIEITEEMIIIMMTVIMRIMTARISIITPKRVL